MSKIYKTFSDWCDNRNKLSPEARHTIEVIIKKANIKRDNFEQLNNLTDLRVCLENLTNLYPLSVLTSLNKLDLSGNQISDLSPLSSLTNLSHLDLS